MSYCINCGAYIPDLSDECPACGAAKIVARPTGGAAAAYAEEKTAEPKQEEKKTEYSYSYTYNTDSGRQAEPEPEEPRQAPPRAEYKSTVLPDEEDALSNKGLGALCYLWILFIVPLVLRPNSRFLRFHANQGLVLAILWLIAGMCFTIPILGTLAGIAGNLLAFVCMIKGILNAVAGKCEPLPVIGGIEIIK